MSRLRFSARLSLPRRFVRSDGGATAVEFGLVAAPFLFLIFAILELAMAFWTSQVLETAVANASRQLYTGQFQTSAGNQNATAAEQAKNLADFKKNLCANVVALFNCMDEVSVDIRPASFSDEPPSPVKNNAFDASGFKYQTIQPNTIGLITAAMQYKMVTQVLAGGATLGNGNRVIMATATFRAEPYTN